MPLPLKITQGYTWRAVFVLQDKAGTPIALIGDAARMHIRPSLESTTVLLELDTAAIGGLALRPGGAVAEVHVTAPAAKTATLPLGTAICDVRVYDTLAPDTTTQLGPVTVVVGQGVTR